MKKLLILLCMAAVLCGCSKAEPTTEATTERELPIVGMHYEGAIFSIPSDWETETRDGKFYMYPDDKSFLVMEIDASIQSVDDSTLDKLIEDTGLSSDDTTTKRTGTNNYGYQFAEVGGIEDIEDGTFWVYEDAIGTQNGTYTITMFNDTSYNDADHLYSTNLGDIVDTFRLE